MSVTTRPVPQVRIAPPSFKRPLVMTLASLVLGSIFVLLAPADQQTTFVFNLGDTLVALPDWVVSSRLAATGFALAALACSAIAWPINTRRGSLFFPAVGVGFFLVMSFLSWVGADEVLPVTGLLQGSLLLAVPLVFGAMAGVLSERAGVININIEGQLLVGAFLGAVVGSLLANAYLGLLAAPVAGALMGLLLAVFATRYFVDQVVVGVVLNVLAVGLTGFLYSRFLTEDADLWNNPEVLPTIAVPVLSEIPILGPILFDQNVIVYLMYVVVIAVQVALFKTRWGLRLRSVGEHPEAADSVGIRVNRTRFRAVVLAGAVAGLGGAFFTLGSVGAFGREMTAGNGFIALAAVIFGRWNPIGALAAALLFGFADNLQNVLSIIGSPIPSQFLLMLPYVVTILAVVGLVGKVRAPGADGIPFKKS
ncbi:MAG: ABC transporter permease [Candidatus Nanopelagicales bacterium]